MTAKLKTTRAGREREAIAKSAAALRLAKKASKDASDLIIKQAQMVPPMNKVDMEELISKTVLKTLASVGIHVQTDEAVEEFRKDMDYTRAWRKTIQRGTKTGFITMITVAVTGFLGMVVVGFRMWLLGHP